MEKHKGDLIIELKEVIGKIDRIDNILTLLKKTLEMIDPDLDEPIETIKQMVQDVALDLAKVNDNLLSGDYND